MIFKSLQRWRHARGFGVHSPFAFQLITDVIYSKHEYYAFKDLRKLLTAEQLNATDFKYNHLVYRLIQYFNPKSVLTIGQGGGVTPLYVASALGNKTAYLTADDSDKAEQSEKIITSHFDNIKFIDRISLKENKFEGIVIDPQNSKISHNELLAVSGENCFWVISGINSGKSKQFWKKTVILNKAYVTFDMKDIGIVIFNTKLSKANYLI